MKDQTPKGVENWDPLKKISPHYRKIVKMALSDRKNIV